MLLHRPAVRASCAVLFLALCAGRASAADDDAQLWLTGVATLPIADDMTGTFLAQTRLVDDIHDHVGLFVHDEAAGDELLL